MDTNTDTKELIKERYQTLPKEVKDAITASDFTNKMKTLASSHSLMLDQTDSLQKAILVIMLGLEPSSTFVDSIISELGINRGKATAIAKDVNQLIFDPIRKYLREWEEQEEKTIQENEKSQSITDLERAGGFTIEHNGQNSNGGAPIESSWGGRGNGKQGRIGSRHRESDSYEACHTGTGIKPYGSARGPPARRTDDSSGAEDCPNSSTRTSSSQTRAKSSADTTETGWTGCL